MHADLELCYVATIRELRVNSLECVKMLERERDACCRLFFSQQCGIPSSLQ
jgi:hypothetical protein